MPTFRDYTNRLAEKLGAHLDGRVSIETDSSDALGMRSILTESFFDPDRQPDSYSGRYLWIGENRDQRRIRSSGYTTVNAVVFEAPETGTYTLTLYGFGTTALLPAKAPASMVLAAIQAIDPEFFSTVTVTGTTRKTIMMPEIIDVAISSGTICSQGGLARIEVTRGFSKPLKQGTLFDIYTKLPIEDADEYQGLHNHVNTGLRRMWIKDLFPVSPNASGIYEKSSIPWIQHPDQISALMGPAEWRYTATFTAPEEGTFRLTFNLLNETCTTEPISVEDLDYDTLVSIVQETFDVNAYTNPFTITDAGQSGPGSQYIFTIPSTLYATPKITTTAGTVRHERIMLTDPVRVSHGYQFMYDAQSPRLVATMFQPGASFYIYGLRPANTWIAPQESYEIPGEIWEDSTTGLFNDYDQAAADIDDVSTITYYLATSHLAKLGPQAETAYWKAEAKDAARIAAHVKLYDLPFDQMPVGRRARYGGKFGYLWG